MTNEFKGSKGKFVVEYNGAWYSVKEAREDVQKYRRNICSVHNDEIINGISKMEQIANANLIAEAFNVVNETGYTPNQLAEQNKELLEALKDIKAAMIFGNNPNDKGLIEIAEAAIANAEK